VPTFLFDHVLWITGLLFVVGAGSARHAYRRTGSLLLSSAIFTFFFSFGFVVYRLALPIPTWLMIVVLLQEASKPKRPLVCDSDGCYDPTDDAQVIILLPWLAQWAFWCLAFLLWRDVFSNTEEDRASPP